MPRGDPPRQRVRYAADARDAMAVIEELAPSTA
jgi:hypothetical protein